MADVHCCSRALQHELVILGLDVLSTVGIICNFIRPSLDSSTLKMPSFVPMVYPHSAVCLMPVAFVSFQFEINYLAKADDEIFALVRRHSFVWMSVQYGINHENIAPSAVILFPNRASVKCFVVPN